jgi:hypothetical protein
MKLPTLSTLRKPLFQTASFQQADDDEESYAARLSDTEDIEDEVVVMQTHDVQGVTALSLLLSDGFFVRPDPRRVSLSPSNRSEDSNHDDSVASSNSSIPMMMNLNALVPAAVLVEPTPCPAAADTAVARVSPTSLTGSDVVSGSETSGETSDSGNPNGANGAMAVTKTGLDRQQTDWKLGFLAEFAVKEMNNRNASQASLLDDQEQAQDKPPLKAKRAVRRRLPVKYRVSQTKDIKEGSKGSKRTKRGCRDAKKGDGFRATNGIQPNSQLTSWLASNEGIGAMTRNRIQYTEPPIVGSFNAIGGTAVFQMSCPNVNTPLLQVNRPINFMQRVPLDSIAVLTRYLVEHVDYVTVEQHWIKPACRQAIMATTGRLYHDVMLLIPKQVRLMYGSNVYTDIKFDDSNCDYVVTLQLDLYDCALGMQLTDPTQVILPNYDLVVRATVLYDGWQLPEAREGILLNPQTYYMMRTMPMPINDGAFAVKINQLMRYQC